ncbi:DUF998 domain-containing protein [Spirosoma aureum]|uniref:DUF998 domain-containing protein n=1 Tax=Spirosoma aureum TaxID=2692134 RepID=A0A6G9ASD1_9BACT|nr:DUF998 domain-containing protein [Spirosoma aureum]QIP15123.1 DUF998 domain-containing protein [Spirosoma aureum]
MELTPRVNVQRKQVLLASGMLAVFFYVLHILLGGILWKGYDHFQQPISDLTATGAPNKSLMLAFTTLYGVLALFFALTFTLFEANKHHKFVLWGGIMFVTLHCISIAYGIFPEDLPNAASTFLGTMHLVITALIVPFTIASPLLIGLGFRKERSWQNVGFASILASCLILLFGGLTAVFYLKQWPYFGIVERMNMAILQAWTFYLSYKLYRNQ